MRIIGERLDVTHEEVKYALDHTELFARFYQQYIAHKAQDARLAKDWNIYRNDPRRTDFQEYWD